MVKIGVITHRVVDARASLEDARQNVVDIAYGKSVVSAKPGNRAVDTRGWTMQHRLVFVSVLTKQQVFALRPPRHQ